jgi:hypothetical protein
MRLPSRNVCIADAAIQLAHRTRASEKEMARQVGFELAAKRSFQQDAGGWHQRP